jgi:hypothetical protein
MRSLIIIAIAKLKNNTYLFSLQVKQPNHLKQKKEFIQGKYHIDLPNIIEMITTKQG